MKGIRLNFWDLGGQEELQSLWDKVKNDNLNFLKKKVLFDCILLYAFDYFVVLC